MTPYRQLTGSYIITFIVPENNPLIGPAISREKRGICVGMGGSLLDSHDVFFLVDVWTPRNFRTYVDGRNPAPGMYKTMKRLGYLPNINWLYRRISSINYDYEQKQTSNKNPFFLMLQHSGGLRDRSAQQIPRWWWLDYWSINSKQTERRRFHW